MRHIEENKICTWRDIARACVQKKAVQDEFLKSVVLTASGKASLCMIFEYLKMKGVLPNKNSEVLVSKWLGYWVYNLLHRGGFPCLEYNERVKVIIVYHQYGFPQNMDEIMGFAEQKNLVVIEDCAHVYESYYKGRRLGTFGLASVFSFSKMFATIMGGGILTDDKELSEYINARIKHDDYFVSMFSFLSKLAAAKVLNRFSKFVEMSYPAYYRNTKMNEITLNLLNAEYNKDAIVRRKRNYEYLTKEMEQYDFFETLEKDVVPYVVPLITGYERLERVKKQLNANGIKTGIYHFDVNRNMLNPRFVQCVWIPVHHGIGENDMERICSIIKRSV